MELSFQLIELFVELGGGLGQIFLVLLCGLGLNGGHVVLYWMLLFKGR